MNELTYNLQVIGFPGSGRSIFVAASYNRSRELLRSLGRASVNLGCTDQATRDFVDRIVVHVRSHGDYPPQGRYPDQLYFHLYNLHAPTRLFGDRDVTVCHWHYHNIELQEGVQPRLLDEADGSFVFVDAFALMDDLNYRTRLDALVEVATNAAQQYARQGQRHPFAVILTKCDLLGQITPALRRVLNQELIPLTESLMRVGALHQVFYSSLAIGEVPGTRRYFLLSSDSAAASLWLIDTIHPLNQAPLNIDLDRLLNAR